MKVFRFFDVSIVIWFFGTDVKFLHSTQQETKLTKRNSPFLFFSSFCNKSNNTLGRDVERLKIILARNKVSVSPVIQQAWFQFIYYCCVGLELLLTPPMKIWFFFLLNLSSTTFVNIFMQYKFCKMFPSLLMF